MKKQRPHLEKGELRFHGTAACRALLQKRPEAIIRAYIRKDLEESWVDLLKACVRNRRSYHLVEDQDLERLTDTTHHQGICLVAKEKKTLGVEELLKGLPREGRFALLYLDGVQNPHNLGAILRTAAHFQIPFVLGAKGELPKLSPAAARVAEGGGEFVDLVATDDVERTIEALKKRDFKVYAADLDKDAYSLYDMRLHERSLFVFGGEVKGVSERLRGLSDHIVKIPGSGAVESLNVSASSALFMGEFFRQSLSSGQRKIVQNR